MYFFNKIIRINLSWLYDYYLGLTFTVLSLFLPSFCLSLSLYFSLFLSIALSTSFLSRCLSTFFSFTLPPSIFISLSLYLSFFHSDVHSFSNYFFTPASSPLPSQMSYMLSRFTTLSSHPPPNLRMEPSLTRDVKPTGTGLPAQRSPESPSGPLSLDHLAGGRPGLQAPNSSKLRISRGRFH